MATITPSSIFIFRDRSGTINTGSEIDLPWADRMAGTAFVESDPMDGVVIVLDLSGPTIVGSTEVRNDGTWSLTGIAERYASSQLLVLGVPRDITKNVALVSRVQPY